jgi:4-carboxymuconolactone decarboxylase
MSTDAERQEYIDGFAERIKDNPPTDRAVRIHKLLAKYDLGVEKANSELNRQIVAGGPLDDKTKELLFVLGYTVRGFDQQHIAWHTRAALRAGASPEEILQALELSILMSGVVPFMKGVEAWADATGAEGIEPTVPAIAMNNDGLPKDGPAPT